MKKIIRELFALLWKLLRAYVLRWFREFLHRFAKIGVWVAIVGFATFALLMLLLASTC
ncbi:MAG: hypothetical protein RMJ98_11745 [Myxococcales bacterium]|nr:hypothetical protein [Polyangiaceae bacterium]MDW8249960.1 hypothetical protein [Myxococcales bacterium]